MKLVSLMRTHPVSLGIRAAHIGISVNAKLALTNGIAGFIDNSFSLIDYNVKDTVFSSSRRNLDVLIQIKSESFE